MSDKAGWPGQEPKVHRAGSIDQGPGRMQRTDDLHSGQEPAFTVGWRGDRAESHSVTGTWQGPEGGRCHTSEEPVSEERWSRCEGRHRGHYWAAHVAEQSTWVQTPTLPLTGASCRHQVSATHVGGLGYTVGPRAQPGSARLG